MRFDEYRNLDGVALAKLVADGEVTAAELLELAIARAEAVNPARSFRFTTRPGSRRRAP